MTTTTTITTTKQTIELASALASRRGIALAGIQVHTPDGRTWEINAVPAGRGRFADGHWGVMPGATGGFRLFEVDHDQDTIDEHDAVDGDTWTAGDLIDYLAAVGEPKSPPTSPGQPDPTT